MIPGPGIFNASLAWHGRQANAPDQFCQSQNEPIYGLTPLLGHNTFTPEALALVVRSGEGLLRRTRNLCLGALIEAVRDQTRIVDLKQVNRVLIQPHWRKDCDQPIAS